MKNISLKPLRCSNYHECLARHAINKDEDKQSEKKYELTDKTTDVDSEEGIVLQCIRVLLEILEEREDL